MGRGRCSRRISGVQERAANDDAVNTEGSVYRILWSTSQARGELKGDISDNAQGGFSLDVLDNKRPLAVDIAQVLDALHEAQERFVAVGPEMTDRRRRIAIRAARVRVEDVAGCVVIEDGANIDSEAGGGFAEDPEIGACDRTNLHQRE